MTRHGSGSGPARSCPEWRDRLVLVLFDEAGPQEGDLVREHLEQCVACRRELDGFRRALRRYGEGFASAHPTAARRGGRLSSQLLAVATVAAIVAIVALLALVNRVQMEDSFRPLDSDTILARGDRGLLHPPPGDLPIGFGHVGGTSDGRIALGAPGAEGAVFLYVRDEDGWRLQGELVQPPGTPCRFATALSLSGDLLAVGCPSARSRSRVFVFRARGNGWRLEQTLLDPDEIGGTLFGTALTSAGDLIVVGASRAPRELGERMGSVYVYEHAGEGWLRTSTLEPDLRVDARFGHSVALEGTRLVVSARGEDQAGIHSRPGNVHVFVRKKAGNWIEEAVLESTDVEPDFFGSMVTIQDPWLVVGAPAASHPDGRWGAAYLFRRNGSEWSLHARIPSPVPNTRAFGGSVALHEDLVAISDPHPRAPLTAFYRLAGDGVRPLRLPEGNGEPAHENALTLAATGSFLLLGRPGDEETPARVELVGARD